MRRVGCSVAASLLTGALLLVGVGASPAAAVPATSFNICPNVDVATGCSVVVVINPDGTRTIVDNPGGASLGVYDGSDDALVGVQNNSSSPVSSIVLSSSSLQIFGFDGDGPCTETTPPVITDCNSADPSGYAGPANTFSNIGADLMSGEVDFAPAIAAGDVQWFALEDTPDASTLTLPSSVGIIADTGTVPPSASDGYTVTVSNTSAAAITVTSVVDTLPTGFTYTAGSTTGAITSNPAISGSTLTWSTSFSVPANGTATFHFGVTVSSTPGTYTDSVTGNSAATLSPATATADIVVGTVVSTPALPLAAVPLAILLAGGVVALWLRRRRLAA